MQNTNLETAKEQLFTHTTPTERMNGEIKKRLLRMREDRFGQGGIQQFENEITELADYLNEHVKEVGKDQAIIDLQVGLNLLNDYKKESLIDTKVQLKEDSDFGDKSYSALLNALQHYPVEIIKRYVRLGALNNQIWNTKNLEKIDTDVKVENTANSLTERNI